MILYSVIADDGAVLSHKTSSEAETVTASVPLGLKAIVGRHIPFGEMADLDGIDFWVEGEALPVEHVQLEESPE